MYQKIFGPIRDANQRGRIYTRVPEEPDMREIIDGLVRTGLLIAVPATTYTLRGYVACGHHGIHGGDARRWD
jgi:hypothetical protein